MPPRRYYSGLSDDSLLITSTTIRLSQHNAFEPVSADLLDPIRLGQYLNNESELNIPGNNIRESVVSNEGYFDCFCFAAWMMGTSVGELPDQPRRNTPPQPGDGLLFYKNKSLEHAAFHLGGDHEDLTLSKLGKFGLVILPRDALVRLYDCDRFEVLLPTRGL